MTKRQNEQMTKRVNDKVSNDHAPRRVECNLSLLLLLLLLLVSGFILKGKLFYLCLFNLCIYVNNVKSENKNFHLPF